MKQTNRKLTLEYVVLCYCHVLGAVIYHALVCAVFLLRPGCPSPQPSFSKIIVARIRPPLYQVISRSACTNIWMYYFHPGLAAGIGMFSSLSSEILPGSEEDQGKCPN